MAERLQRKRTKGARLPKGTVCVTRPSRWANPYRVGGPHPVHCWPMSRSEAVELFASRLFHGSLPFSVEDAKRELAGKDLACYCPLPAKGERDECHASVLIAVANG